MPEDALNSTPTDDSSKPRYAAPALDKGLAILELLADEGDPHTQAEIARRLGRSQGEIRRMLVSLERNGYISRGPGDERYALTSKLFQLAHGCPPTTHLTELATPAMRRFAEQTDQSIHLTVHQSRRAVVVAQVNSPSSVNVAITPGRTLELHDSVSGRALLAFDPVELQSRWLRRLKAKLSASAYKELTSALERLRADGYTCAPSKVVHGVTDLAVPVLGREGVSAAALAVPYLPRKKRSPAAEETDIRRVLKHMQRVAREISTAGARTHT